MTAAFVVDCSVAMTWLFKDETTAVTLALLNRLENESALVPELWFLEVANVLALAERKSRIRADQSVKFVHQITTLQMQVDTDAAGRAFTEVLDLARDHGLTTYDATYLDLAVRRNLPLATLDEPLRKAAKKLRVKLLGL
jgi:predicted nucleic acid-binding protein